MNTLAVSVVCAALAQVPSSQYVPFEEEPPVVSSPVESETSSAVTSPPRVTDDDPAPRRPNRFQMPAEFEVESAPYAAPRHEPARTTTLGDAGPAQSSGMRGSTQSAFHSATRQLNEAIQASVLEGEPLPLLDVLRRHSDPTSRKRALQAYWRTAIAVANHSFALQEVDCLRQLPQPATQLEQVVLEAERTRAAAAAAESAVQVLQAQAQLADSHPLTEDALSKPADVPFVGPYKTELATIFSGRVVPTSLRQIDRALPRQLDLIARRGEAVEVGERLLAAQTEAYAAGAASLEATLSALRQLREERRAFTSAVRVYNEQIAEYALAVVSPSLAPEMLLGTLIRADMAAPTMLADANVRPASAEQPVLQPKAARAFRELEPTQAASRAASGSATDLQDTRSILRGVVVDHH